MFSLSAQPGYDPTGDSFSGSYKLSPFEFLPLSLLIDIDLT